MEARRCDDDEVGEVCVGASTVVTVLGDVVRTVDGDGEGGGGAGTTTAGAEACSGLNKLGLIVPVTSTTLRGFGGREMGGSEENPVMIRWIDPPEMVEEERNSFELFRAGKEGRASVVEGLTFESEEVER